MHSFGISNLCYAADQAHDLPLMYCKNVELFQLPWNLKYGCLINQVTFVVTHFNDPRISSAELRDLLLQSISVLVQYKEFLAAFENNKAATQEMPKALLSAFDNRSWIPVTNILLRLCKGSGFGSSRHGESSSSSFVFQVTDHRVFVLDAFSTF